jgi:hypothetical protein
LIDSPAHVWWQEWETIMALFERDIETGQRKAIGAGRYLPTFGAFKGSKDTDPFAGRLLKQMSRDSKALKGVMGGIVSGGQFNTSLKFQQNAMQAANETAKNTSSLASSQKSDLRLQASTNQFSQRNFRINKQYLTRAAKYFDKEEKSRKGSDEYYKETKKLRKSERRREKKLDAQLQHWQREVLHALKGTKDNTETLQRQARLQAVGKIGGGLIKLISAPFTGVSRAMGKMAKPLKEVGVEQTNTTREVKSGFLGLKRSMRQLGRTLERGARATSAKRVFGQESRAPERAQRRDRRAEAKDIRELRQRGFTSSEIKSARRQGMSPADLIASGEDRRTRGRKVSDLFRRRNLLNRRGILGATTRGATRGIGAGIRGGMGAARMGGRVLGGALRFAPAIGAAVGGIRAVQQAQKGNFFGAAVSGAGAAASLIPGLGPIVSIALESLAKLVPEGVQEAFNKFAGEWLSKLFPSGLGGGDSPFKMLIDAVGNVGEIFTNIWGILRSTIFSDPALKVFGAIGKFLIGSASTLIEGIGAFSKFFADIFSGDKSIIQSLVDNLIPFVEKAVKRMGPLLLDMAVSIGNLLISGLKGAVVAIIGKTAARAIGISIPETETEKREKAELVYRKEQASIKNVEIDIEQSRKAISGIKDTAAQKEMAVRKAMSRAGISPEIQEEILARSAAQGGMKSGSLIDEYVSKGAIKKSRAEKIKGLLSHYGRQQSLYEKKSAGIEEAAASLAKRKEASKPPPAAAPAAAPVSAVPPSAPAKPPTPTITPPMGPPGPPTPTAPVAPPVAPVASVKTPAAPPAPTTKAPGGAGSKSGGGGGGGFQFGQTTLDQDLRDAAKASGIDLSFLQTMARIESGGNPNAVSPTGATGIFQFTKGTGRGYGLVGPGFDKRKDQRANVMAGAQLARDNARSLKRAGIPPSDAMLYMAHQQGVGGVIAITRAAQSGGPVSPNIRYNMDVNSGKGLSAGQFLQKWQNKWTTMAGKTGGLGVAPAGGGGGGGLAAFAGNLGQKALGAAGMLGGAVSGVAGTVAGAIGGAGGISGAIEQATSMVTQGLSAIPGLGAFGNAGGLVASAMLGAGESLAQDMMMMQNAMSQAISADPTSQKQLTYMKQITEHTRATANKEDPNATKIQDNSGGVFQALLNQYVTGGSV